MSEAGLMLVLELLEDCDVPLLLTDALAELVFGDTEPSRPAGPLAVKPVPSHGVSLEELARILSYSGISAVDQFKESFLSNED